MNRQQKLLGCVTLLTVLENHLDASNAREFKDIIAQLQNSSPQLVLDLGQVRVLDCTGCGALLTALGSQERLGGQIKLCCLTEPVRQTLDLFQMLRFLEVYPTRDEAIGAFLTGPASLTSSVGEGRAPPQPIAAARDNTCGRPSVVPVYGF